MLHSKLRLKHNVLKAHRA